MKEKRGFTLFFKIFFAFIFFSIMPTMVYLYLAWPSMEISIVLWFVSFLSVMVAFVVAKNIVSPLRTLIVSAKRISWGDFDVRVNINTDDEIGQLAKHFNGMAENLSLQHDQLQEEARVLLRRDKALSSINNQLQSERDKIKTIIADLTDGLIVFDKNNNIILFNPAACSLLEINKEFLEGKQTKDLLIYPYFSKLADIIGVGAVKKGVFRKELVLKPKGKIVEISTLPLIEDATITGFIVILHDITREKLMEETKNEFISIAAHQLRTPLSALKWMLKMAIQGDLGVISAEQEDIFKKGYRTNERMITLINDLLNVSRLEEGRFLFEFKEKNVGEIEELVRETIKMVSHAAEAKKVAINFSGPGKMSLRKARIDMEKLKLVIQNLVDNAIKYSRSKVDIAIFADGDERELFFSVKDDGIGISKEQQERIFSKFFRGDNAVRKQTEGSGLGLFIVKNIIEKHDGKIWFESQENKGSTFYFALPLFG